MFGKNTFHKPVHNLCENKEVRPTSDNTYRIDSLFHHLGPKSEDCLFLNVFVPSSIKPTDKMAVMVWFHGGGFVLGSSTGYPGGVLASFNDVIVVSVNFRLAILGFFNVPGTDTKGNYGMLDQVG